MLEGKDIEFSIGSDNKLVWKDGLDDAGKDLAFTNVGPFFSGNWKQAANETDAVKVKIVWLGLDPEEMYYTVYVVRGEEGVDDLYTETLANCFYDPDTGKLGTDDGSMTVHTKNENGEYDIKVDEDGNTPVYLSFNEDGQLVLEGETNIVLEEDFSNEG